jgi:ABC exporter DevB family membrane fusion protein
LLTGISSLCFAVLPGSGFGDPPRDSNPAAQLTVHALARLEPESGLLTVGARPGARILKIEVEEGAAVKPGQLLAILEGNEEARKQVDLAVARKAEAQERRSRARRKASLERRQIDKTLELRRSALASQVELTNQKNDRAQALYKGMSAIGAVAKLPPKDQIELEAGLYLLQMQASKTRLELDELEARKGSLADQRALEDEELADGGADDQLLDRQIDLAKAALTQTQVIAPSEGTILAVHSHAGEVSGGPLLTMGDLTSIVAKAEVDQSDVGKIRIGAVTRMTIDGRPVTGKVTRIGSLVGFNQMRSIDPRAPQDVRVVLVTVRLDQSQPASHYINMQVDTAIDRASGGDPGGAPTAAR